MRAIRSYKPLMFIAILSFSIAMFVVAYSQTVMAAPADFEVTNTNNSGVGSLRQAIIDANSNGNPGDQDTISFNIANSNPSKIILDGDIVISQPVLIDGYTQTGSIVNTAPFPEPFNGKIYLTLSLANLSVMHINAPNVEISGVAIGMEWTVDSWPYIIQVEEADNFTLRGSYLGVDYSGISQLSLGNGQPTTLLQIVDSDDVIVGGGTAQDRNVFGHCVAACIDVRTDNGTSDGLQIQGNYIGVAADGLGTLIIGSPAGIILGEGVTNALIGGPEQYGNFIANMEKGAIWARGVIGLEIYGNFLFRNKAVYYDSQGRDGVILLEGVQDVNIGDPEAGFENRFGDSWNASSVKIKNNPNGDVASENIWIKGNIVGYNLDETMPLPEWNGAVIVTDDTRYVMIQENVIHNSGTIDATNGDKAITIDDNAQDVSIIQNSIYNSSLIGIDLGNNGVSGNDELDVDAGPNGLLNSPGYTQIVEDGGNTNITFTADLPVGDYLVEFYSNTALNPSGNTEGETLLDSTEITSTGEGIQEFNISIVGTGFENIALTATEIDPSTPSGYGATSEFGTEGEPMPVGLSDLSVTKKLLNPEDFALGNTLDYEITISNNGPSEVDLSIFTSASPGQDSLFTDILPPQLTYAGITGADIGCFSAGSGSASMFGPVLANHSSYELVFCAHTGSTILAEGDDITYILSATVVDDSEPSFTNYLLVPFRLFENLEDVDAENAASITTSGDDIIDGFTAVSINNFAMAVSTPTDIAISKTLNNPQDMAVGAELEYTLTLTNLGPTTFDPTQYDLSGINPLATAVFVDLLPPNLTYVSQSNVDLDCSVLGPGSLAGSLFADHADHNIVACGYYGADSSIAMGETISTTLTVEVQSIPDEFTNVVMGGFFANDTEAYLMQALLIQGEDILSGSLERGYNNVDDATYSITNDYDADSVPDLVEASLAPGGDGNDDGIQDKLQGSVATASNPVNGSYVTLEVTDACESIGAFTVTSEASQSAQDSTYAYPLGLQGYELGCGTGGQTAQVKFYFDRQYNASSWQVRKLLGDSYSNLDAATIGSADVGGNLVTTIAYAIQDGSSIDEDNSPNGQITDPSGPGVLSATTENGGSSAGNAGGAGLSETGSKSIGVVAFVILLGAVGAIVYVRRQPNGNLRARIAAIDKRVLMSIVVVGAVTIGAIGYVMLRPNASTQKKVVYDSKDQVQDLKDGLLDIPADAKSFVCDAISVKSIEDTTGQSFKVGRVTIPTTRTDEGQVAACGYDSADTKSTISSIIITQREFTDANKAKSSYELLQKVSKKSTKLSNSAYYNTSAQQVVSFSGSTLTTASIALRDKAAFNDSIYKKLSALL